MKTWTIYTDLHIGSSYEMKVQQEFGEDVIYIGDNYELKNIPYKDVPKRISIYLGFLKRCRDSGTVALQGNHERKAGTKYCGRDYYVNDGVLFMHGDEIDYSSKKLNRWRYGNLGNYWLALFLIGIYTKVFRYESSTISKREITNAVNMLRYFDCHTMVWGHRHSRRIIDIVEVVDGIPYRLVNLPRGKNVVIV